MKNKKILLIASASVLAGAIATAGVASFAWFQSTASMSFTKLEISNAAITVAENDMDEADLKATIHISATASSNDNVLLSEWYDSDEDSTLDALQTNVKDTNGDLHPSQAGKLYEVYTIKMWITRDNNSEGTQAEWNKAKGESTKVATYTFAFDEASSTNLVASDVAYFTDAASTITYAKETANVKTLSKAVSEMQTTENSEAVVGYFFVRIKGDAKNHVTGTSYSAAFDATCTALA